MVAGLCLHIWRLLNVITSEQPFTFSCKSAPFSIYDEYHVYIHITEVWPLKPWECGSTLVQICSHLMCTQSTSIKLYWTRRCHLPGCYRSQQFVKSAWETSICQTLPITTCIINRPTRLFAVWQIHPSASSILKHFWNYNQFACFYCKAETVEMDVCQTSWSSVWPRNILTKINKSLNRKMHHFYYEKTIRD